MEKVTTMFDYLIWRGDLSFNQSPYNGIDGLILSTLVYLDLKLKSKEKMKLSDVIDYYFTRHDETEKLGLLLPEKVKDLALLVRNAKRFQDLYISNIIEVEDAPKILQFYAYLVHINEDEKVVCYRGTDDTLIGWLEDFEMGTRFPVEAQSYALDYLKEVMKKDEKSKYHLVGHSKGGNLAMYASIFSEKEDQERIIDVYNYDGPGFEEGNVDEAKYALIKDKIHTILPYQSVVGIIFNQYGDISVVKSNHKGLWQHDPLSWGIKGNDFIYAKDLKKNNKKFDQQFNELISLIPLEDKISLCNNVKKYIEETKCHTLLDLSTNNKLKLIPATSVFTKEDREIINKIIRLAIVNTIIR